MVSAAALRAQEEFFIQEHVAGNISRNLLNNHLHGIRMPAGICETGTFRWKVLVKKKT